MSVCQFGPFQVLARLASGGAASVFLARKENTSGPYPWRLVCLKTLLQRRADDEDFVAMFLDEARLGHHLKHPCCVRVEDYGELQGIKFQVMEFVFGMTVWELLGSVPRLKKALPRTAVAQLLSEALRGLHFAHQLKNKDGEPYNLIHRDISPQNVMLTYEGAVKLLDFGVARAETGRNATVTGVVKGKFAYMSPEQISGTLIDHRSDIYSMGIVMFECLASRRLYKGETPQEIASMIIENRPPRLSTIVPDIDPVLDAICAKALSFSAKDRFSDAEEMAEVLDEYLQKSKSRSNFISLREVVEDRFDAQYARRKQLVEAIRKGTYDERELMEVFSARPVLDLDFQSNDVAIENGGVSKEALRVPFAVDETISNESGISLAEEAQTLGMIRPVEQLVDIEDTIATTLGDGIRSADTSLPLLKEPQGRPLIEKTVPHIETLDPEFEIRATVAAAQIEGAPPKPSVSTNETSRYSPSVSSRQTYTLGVVLTALLLGCCLGTAIGLYLARSLGI